MLDQGLEVDLVADIQKYLEDLISSGLRQRLISLIKVFGSIVIHIIILCLLKQRVIVPYWCLKFLEQRPDFSN